MPARKIVLPIVLVICWGADSLQAEPDVFSTLTQEVQTVFQNAKGAVVKIRADDKHGRCVGSGFFIDPNGTIYTTYAVGGDSTNIIVEAGEHKYPATRLVADSRSGIALLKVDASTPFLPLSSGHRLAIASPVVAIGYPMDLPATPTVGFVGGFDLKYLDRYFTTTHIRANVSVQRGESGAPLLNPKGEVVGILMSGLDGGSACYALPIEAAEKVRNDFVRYGEVRHGWIGIKVVESKVPQEGSRVLIDTLLRDTPATVSGIQSGDTLVKIGDTPIAEVQDVLNGSFFLTAGETVAVEVIRDGSRLSFSVRAAEHPASEKHRSATPFGESLRLTRGN